MLDCEQPVARRASFFALRRGLEGAGKLVRMTFISGSKGAMMETGAQDEFDTGAMLMMGLSSGAVGASS